MEEIDIEAMLESPVEGVEKDKLPLVNGWTNTTGKRDSKAISCLSCLFLDYDSGYSISEFMRKYYKFRFYLYTSSSHTPQKNKFRVIIPLEEEITVLDYEDSIKKALPRYFPECDPTAFYLDHFFYIPAKRENEYIYKINYGRLFNIKSDLKNQILQEKIFNQDKKIKQELINQYAKSKPQHIDKTNEIRVEFNDILSAGNGSGRYSKLFYLIGRYKKHYKTLLIDLLMWSDYENKDKMIKLVEKE